MGKKDACFPMPSLCRALGGHVFMRTGKGRTPIKKLWGPAIPSEMVKHQTKAAFEQTVEHELPARLLDDVDAILAGRLPAR
ncbi:hypothetical protein [Bradyrhizobium sp.]|uniref:hypothetical protein n=1 Tax=Bradyrhizobium sp. TaxID=376 RepID=UPI002606BA4F|nr:hypothetical protein [Bradyrhizobium sp.]